MIEDNRFIVETSARHIHLTKQHFEMLFGEDAELTVRKELSQPGQFASEQRVDVIGPKGEIEGVIILGPFRSATQLEVSLTDARALGIKAPVRESGSVQGSPGCRIRGPKGEITIDEGVIAAQRHIHVTPEDAGVLNVSDRQIVNVLVKSENRTVIFSDVLIRISPKFSTAMHIDTDESNAAGGASLAYGVIVDKENIMNVL